MTYAIEVTDATRYYGTKRGVRDLSLAIPSGTILGLLGENGSGKTTALKLAMGTLLPDRGRVRTLGVDPGEMEPAVRARIGLPVENLRQHWIYGILLLFLLLPSLIVPPLWRMNRASGMSPMRAFRVLLVELTVVGFVFRDYFGVARGTLVRCGFCNGWRLPWQEACPHCYDQRRVPAINFTERRPGLLARHDPYALFFRIGVPVFLFSRIFFENYERWFSG